MSRSARIDWDDSAIDQLVVRVSRDALDEVSAEILDDAKRLAPVDTGDLQLSLDREIAPDGSWARIGSDLDYAAAVELGTSRTHAQPYLRPALYRKRG